MTKAYLKSFSPSEMEKYINHHVRVAGVKKQLFEPAAITAIHQKALPDVLGELTNSPRVASWLRPSKNDTPRALYISEPRPANLSNQRKGT